MCGGTATLHGLQRRITGLSPRVRGNLHCLCHYLALLRSIPACAGEPVSVNYHLPHRSVYPRVCGGTHSIRPSGCTTQGLSPRVRGNLSLASASSPDSRSIPACAGEPTISIECGKMWGVYPRVCGGTEDPTDGKEMGPGLSPRVRGNPSQASPFRSEARSIPACAGEPTSYPAPATVPGVYPRVCGGTPAPPATKRTRRGLSPRVRGNRKMVADDLHIYRSIPACAGEPPAVLETAALPKVYPRVCGGTTDIHPQLTTPTGLSPRVRGNHSLRSDVPYDPRSIPACAGEPYSDFLVCLCSWVYPRVCGGTLIAARRVHILKRSIPACAGEPDIDCRRKRA